MPKKDQKPTTPGHTCGRDRPSCVTTSPEHGGISLPRITSLGEDGGPTVIGEGRVQAQIPPDDVWYSNTTD
jgi:hypothetical protein